MPIIIILKNSRYATGTPTRVISHIFQARSELRFWRGAEVDNVQNPKQLYVINLEKVRKLVSFWQLCRCAVGENYNFCEIFYASARGVYNPTGVLSIALELEE